MTMLKLQDTPVLSFNLSTGDFHVIDNEKLPFLLRDGMIDSSNDSSVGAFAHNYERLMGFLRNRSLSIDRTNAKSILNALHISQNNNDDEIVKMMILCKGLSASDDYWLSNDESERWSSVNLRENPLHEVLAQIALYGDSPLTITGRIRTPELTGQGAYAKAWYRINKELYLYKASTNIGRESEIEAEVSNILDYTNVPHVHYDFKEVNGKRCCICKDLCDNRHSIVEAYDVLQWCNRTGRDFDKFVRELDPENFYKTIVTDYLISNNDRHTGNWGFYMDNQTGKLTGLHPIFDHNNAFATQDLRRSDGGESLMMEGKKKREAAKYAVKHCDYHIEKIPSSVFINKEHEATFKKRAESLKLYRRSFWEKANIFKRGFLRFPFFLNRHGD